MIKKAFEYIVGLSAPVVQEIKGETYSDKPLNRISYVPRASSIEMGTLSSLIDYIKSGVDIFSEKMIIHVLSPTYVAMYSALDEERKREYVVEVKANVPAFAFNQFIDHESFCIGVQSKCIDGIYGSNDKALLLKFAGTVESGSLAEYGDDGVSQKATVKTGIASKGEALVPNPVTLKPYRTFVEVDQPISSFIFRMKEDKYSKGIQCALYEADGGAWKIEAMENIKNYLVNELAEYENFIIIS
jgi:hypothetical protein